MGRYCYRSIPKCESVSDCLCKGALCKKCLIQEILITVNRNERKAKCTVCNKNREIRVLVKNKGVVFLDFVKYFLFRSSPLFPCFKKPWISVDRLRLSNLNMFLSLSCMLWFLFSTFFDIIFGIYLEMFFRIPFFILELLFTKLMFCNFFICESKRWKGWLMTFFAALLFVRSLILMLWIFVLFTKGVENFYNAGNIPSKPRENTLLRETAFSLFWFGVSSVVNFAIVSVMNLFLVASEFKEDYRKNREIMVGNKGPFDISREMNK